MSKSIWSRFHQVFQSIMFPVFRSERKKPPSWPAKTLTIDVDSLDRSSGWKAYESRAFLENEKLIIETELKYGTRAQIYFLVLLSPIIAIGGVIESKSLLMLLIPIIVPALSIPMRLRGSMAHAAAIARAGKKLSE